MSVQTIGNMTYEELRALVAQMILETLKAQSWTQQPADRSVLDVLESMRQNIIKPAPGSPSTLELLREDRDR